MKRTLPLLFAIIMLLGTFSCAKTPNTSNSPATTTQSIPTSTAVETTTSQSSGFKVVTDLTGKDVEVPTEVKRVCGSIAALEEVLLLLGAGDKNVVGNEWNKQNPWFIKLQPELANLPSIFINANTVNMEALLQLDPDVVFVGDARIRDTLIDAGVPALVVSFGSLDDIPPALTLIASVLGDDSPAIAAELIAEYQANIERVSAITKSIQKELRPTVFYAANGPLNTEGSASIVTSWIELAGGVNIAAEHGVGTSFVDVTIETLLEWDPDVIICRDYTHYLEYMNDSRFATLSAVKNGRVFTNPCGAFVWCARSADEILQIVWAPTVIQPELFTDVDMSTYVKDFYAKYYRYDLTDAEVREILFLDTD